MALGDNRYIPSFVVYGPHGSGLSSALKAFRDLQYQTSAGVNLESLDRFLLLAQSHGQPVALSPALNPFRHSPEEITAIFETLKAHNRDLKFLYLSTPVEDLIQRFAASEKRHPLEHGGLKETIEKEIDLYTALKPLSDYHIDTSTTTEKELALKIARVLGLDVGTQPMTIHLTSFGFKHGVPTDSEMVFDMRFLPNPFYDPELRPQTGLDSPVRDYVFSFPEVHKYLEHWQGMLAHSLPMYQQQGKARLKISIGCTGGQHRSVAMTMAIADYLKKQFPDFEVHIQHREQHHWPRQATTPQQA